MNHPITRFTAFLGLFLLPLCTYGQNVTVVEDPSIISMMQKFVSANQGEETIRGWRIQIITTDDRRQMEKARSKFLGMYPDIKLSWEHVSPYYKVQIGAYETRMSLQPFLLELKNDFRSAIPVMDNVKKSELIQY